MSKENFKKTNEHNNQIEKDDQKNFLKGAILYKFIGALWKDKKRVIKFGIFLSLLFLVLLQVFFLTAHIQRYLGESVRSLSLHQIISVKSKENVSFYMAEDIQKIEGVLHTHIYIDEYKLLGLGFKSERYQKNEVLPIGDDILPIDEKSLKIGRLPKQDHEIVLSYSTAEKLVENTVDEILGMKMIGWYKNGLNVISINYHVVGISTQTTKVNTFYQKTGATYNLLCQKTMSELKSSILFVYIKDNYLICEVIKKVEELESHYIVQEVGYSLYGYLSRKIFKLRVSICLFVFVYIGYWEYKRKK